MYLGLVLIRVISYRQTILNIQKPKIVLSLSGRRGAERMHFLGFLVRFQDAFQV